MEIHFRGIGCVSCLDSLPARIQRIRGVESATVDAEHAVVKVQLAAQNRVRLEQMRDMIEQDGTKVTRASVRVKGEVRQQDGQWLLQPAGVPASYLIQGTGVAAGMYLVRGEVEVMRPDSGMIVIRATDVERAD
jgi:hypothetical protein